MHCCEYFEELIRKQDLSPGVIAELKDSPFEELGQESGSDHERIKETYFFLTLKNVFTSLCLMKSLDLSQL